MNRQQRRQAARSKARQPPKHLKHQSLLRDGSRVIIPPHKFARAAVSNEPLEPDLIAEIITPYRDFIEQLKAGTATTAVFYGACENHYLYIAFLEVLRHAKIRAAAETETLFKLDLSINLDTAIDHTTEVFEAIAARYNQRGKWIASGEEIKHLEQTLTNFENTLNLASWQHYIAAVKESEPILQAEAHRQRKTSK